MLAQACTCNQTHVQMKHSLAHLQDLIPTLAGVVAYMFIPAKVEIGCFYLQSLIGPANLLSAISCYKFHISKDQQENMKFTIICHLAAFLFINSH